MRRVPWIQGRIRVEVYRHHVELPYRFWYGMESHVWAEVNHMTCWQRFSRPIYSSRRASSMPVYFIMPPGGGPSPIVKLLVECI